MSGTYCSERNSLPQTNKHKQIGIVLRLRLEKRVTKDAQEPLESAASGSKQYEDYQSS